MCTVRAPLGTTSLQSLQRVARRWQLLERLLMGGVIIFVQVRPALAMRSHWQRVESSRATTPEPPLVAASLTPRGAPTYGRALQELARGEREATYGTEEFG